MARRRGGCDRESAAVTGTGCRIVAPTVFSSATDRLFW